MREKTLSMAAQSLLLPSPFPQIPTISAKSKTLTLNLALSFSSTTKPSSFSVARLSPHSFPVARKSRNLRWGLVRNVAVSSDVEQEEEEEEEEEEVNFSPDLKIFVGNLPFNVDSSDLAGLFERAGTVEMVEVIYDKLTGKSRGFGFVTMSSVAEVEAAVRKFNGYELSGRALRVNSGPPPRRDELPSRGFRGGGGGGGGGGSGGFADSSNRVYVGNLSWGVDNLALETLFSEQGRVIDAKVVYDRESGRSRGFGFVTFSSAEEVNNAISSLDGADLDGRQIRVTVAEERQRRQF